MKVNKAWRKISKLAVTEPLSLCESGVKMVLFNLEGLVLSPSAVFEVILEDDYKVTS